MRRALVLGGGGITGPARETGLVAALAEGGVQLGAMLGTRWTVPSPPAPTLIGRWSVVRRAVLIVAAVDEAYSGLR